MDTLRALPFFTLFTRVFDFKQIRSRSAFVRLGSGAISLTWIGRH